MQRREFLKYSAIAGCGLFFGERLDLITPAEAAERYDLVAARGAGKSASFITKAAVDAFGGMKRFISRGDVVVIKPNIGWDRTPEQAANTNPIVVAALVELAYAAGAKKVKVFDNTCNAARRCYKNSGIEEAARATGADVFFVEDRRLKKVNLGGEILKEWPVYADALEADKIINVPIAKQHSLARITLSMKNLMGLIGGSRNLLHQKLDTNIVDLAAFFKPSLTVLDAVRILRANGPQGGNLNDVKIANTVSPATSMENCWRCRRIA